MQPISPRLVSAIALGGALGAIARYQLAELLPNDFLALMLANTLGSLLLGLLIQYNLTDQWRGFWQVGAMGSFTSMSAVIVLISTDLSSFELVTALVTTFLFAPLAVQLGKLLRISR